MLAPALLRIPFLICDTSTSLALMADGISGLVSGDALRGCCSDYTQQGGIVMGRLVSALLVSPLLNDARFIRTAARMGAKHGLSLIHI